MFIYLPREVPHLEPVKSELQLQMKKDPTSKHIPPLRQGLEAHGVPVKVVMMYDYKS